MINYQLLDDIVNKVIAKLPLPLQNAKKNLAPHLRKALQATFKQLALVEREEFDIQCKVLAQLHTKLQALEAIIAAFEKQKDSHATHTSTVPVEQKQ